MADPTEPSRSAAEPSEAKKAAHPGKAEAGARVVLIGREGCHLCDDARAVIEAVTAELGEAYVEWDIDADPALAAKYADEIPVVLVDGAQIAFWRVDRAKLTQAITGSDKRRPWRRGRT